MAHQLAQTNGTSKLQTLPALRSPEYVEWLILEIGNLAVYLGQQQQLDSAGYRQAEMAKDLASTVPAAMKATFTQLRRTCRFLPTTAEILDTYSPIAARLADEAAEGRARAEKAAFTRELAEHPERFLPVTRLNADIAAAAKKLALDRPAPARPQITLPDPTPQECPHCGRPVPLSMIDLAAFTAADLRSMADRREAKAAEIAAIAEAMVQAHGRKEAK